MKFLVGSLISLLLCAGQLLNPPAAQAIGCRNSGPKDSSLALGSQVDGKLFTICAETFSTKQVAKKNASKNSRPVKINPKVNPTGQVVFTYLRVGDTTRVSFKPVAPKAKRNTTGALRVNQNVQFAIDQKVKLGANYVFGKRLGVRFTPIDIRVSISDGSTAQTFNPQHSFASAGTYRLAALVTYRAEYRTLVAGEFVNKFSATWIIDPETISIASNTVKVVVAEGESKVVLVSNSF